MPLGHRCPGKPCYDVITVIETRLRNGSFFSAEASIIVFVTPAEQLSHKNKQGFLMKTYKRDVLLSGEIHLTF